MNYEIALRWVGTALNVMLLASGHCLVAAFVITDESIREFFGKSYLYLFIVWTVGLVVARARTPA
jgi:hypothetical protein